MTADPLIRPIDRRELPEFGRTIATVFGEDPREEDREYHQWVFEPERSLAVFDGEDIVGTTAIYTRDLTVPGAVLPAAGVTMVAVASTHRRRGYLTAMMRRQLTELFESGGEAVAALWASESMIYGRFGYGLAGTYARTRALTHRMRFRSDAPAGTGRVRLVSPEKGRPAMAEAYEAVRPNQPGFLSRPGRWWDHRLYDPTHYRDGATALRVAVHEEADGRATGYAVYRVKQKFDVGDFANEIQIRELVAATPAAYAALWSFLASMDLVREVVWDLAPTEPLLRHLLVDSRGMRTEVVDSLWVRVVDVGRALAGRRYAAPVDVVLDVTDEFCPWNAGRWRLSAGADSASCERTTDSADLSLSAAELGAVYLGGTPLSALAGAGRVHERRAGAMVEAARAFGHHRAPWCPEIF